MNYYPQQSYPAYKPYFQPQPQYQQPPVYQPQPMQMQPMEQDGSIAARFASGREEAVASFVVPGRPAIFYDRAGGCIFVKSVDPQTGAAEIKTFVDLDHKKEDSGAQPPHDRLFQRSRRAPIHAGRPRPRMAGRPWEPEYPMEMRAGNSYGDIYAHGSIYAPGAMNKPGMPTHMRTMPETRAEDEYTPIDEHTARDWVRRMTGGEHFRPEQTEQFRSSMCPDCDKWEFYAAMNAAKSDYGKTAQKTGLDRPEFFAMLATDFLNDKDAKPNKLARYMREIAK